MQDHLDHTIESFAGASAAEAIEALRTMLKHILQEAVAKSHLDARRAAPLDAEVLEWSAEVSLQALRDLTIIEWDWYAWELQTGKPAQPATVEAVRAAAVASRSLDNLELNFMLLKCIDGQLSRTRDFKERVLQLVSLSRHTQSSERTRHQISHAVNLYLLGMDAPCLVYCFAAIEASLQRRHAAASVDTAPTGPDGWPPKTAWLVKEYLSGAPRGLARRTHSLRRARNELLHALPMAEASTGLRSCDALKTLTDVLDFLDPWGGVVPDEPF
jgi:hypothetical protein